MVLIGCFYFFCSKINENPCHDIWERWSEAVSVPPDVSHQLCRYNSWVFKQLFKFFLLFWKISICISFVFYWKHKWEIDLNHKYVSVSHLIILLPNKIKTGTENLKDPLQKNKTKHFTKFFKLRVSSLSVNSSKICPLIILLYTKSRSSGN